MTDAGRNTWWRRALPAAMLALFILCAGTTAEAQGMRLLRDDETEETLRLFARPVLEQAGLSPSAVRVILVDDPTLNAFVAGGQNIFFHTGLLLNASSAEELVGVIAHESGHIASGHLARLAAEMEQISMQAFIGQLLGLAVAIGAGSGEAGVATASAAQTIALRNMMRHSRIQESAADQAGVRYLEGAGLPIGGFISFMEKLAAQELLPESQQSAYVRTHPISQDRVAFLIQAAASAPAGQIPEGWDDRFRRMQAKLEGYLFPERALTRRGDDIATRYGHAIAYERRGDITRALATIDGLIAQEPENPYFHELKGQILFERGQIDAAIPAYRKAARLAPDSGLIAIAYAHSLLEADTPQIDEALRQLQRALRLEPNMPRVHHLLTIAYGRKGDEGMARLHQAERSLMLGRLPQARAEVNLALNALPEKSAARQRALDIIDAIAQAEQRRRKR